MAAAILILAALIIQPADTRAQTVLPGNLKDIVYRNAPFIAAETYNYFYVQRFDHILPVDFDGDLLGADNNSITPTTIVDGRPTIYYSVAETGYSSDHGYYFLGYYIYHVNDGGQDFIAADFRHVEGPGHEHDMEGVYFVVKKSPYFPLGVLTVALSEAHGALIPTENTAQSAVALGEHAPAGGNFRFFRENRGEGMLSAHGGERWHTRTSRHCWGAGRGLS
jgi:hypothetical protein